MSNPKPKRKHGERWPMRMAPRVLMELMRREDIGTTMKYYVGQNAQQAADVLWQAHGENEQKSDASDDTSKNADPSNSENSSITE